jgi:putative DNA primase/helicase
MFDSLGPDEPPGADRVTSIWRAIMPVPNNVPGAFPPHRLGKPDSWWVYMETTRRRLFEVARFDKQNGDKEVLPLTFCEGPDGKREWRWQAPPAPRPLYGLDRLAQRPESPVLISEGEKVADAAAALFPDYVAVTSHGGARAAAKSHWRPLRGRSVIVWPDHDIKRAETTRQTLCGSPMRLAPHPCG